MKRHTIPVHQMNTISSLGLEFRYMEVTDEHIEVMLKYRKNEAHRDDYYMFMFLEKAQIAFAVDFEDVELCAGSVFYIRPGQVHFASSVQEAKGWSLAIDAMLIDDACKKLFEGQLSTQKPLILDTHVLTIIRQTTQLLHAARQMKPTEFTNKITLDLANVFIGIIAEQYAQQQEGLQHNKSRSAQIVHRFKGLLSENFKTIKSPSEYVRMLNYSLSHLNESVKNTTGVPVSYWIHQQVVLEAKRLLYYTNLDIKEIAFQLGYEDHTYFTRLFTKTVGLSPSAFRQKFHE